jgi:5-methylcytosine-specific restriction protein A
VTLKPPSCCRTPTCGGYAVERGYCSVCIAAIPAVDAKELFDKTHPFQHLYYTARWRVKLRPLILRRDPICVVCNHNPSTIVDHVIDHRGDETLFFDPANLRGICKPCHDFKTGSTHGGNRKNATAGDKPYLIANCISDPSEQLARQEGSKRRNT